MSNRQNQNIFVENARIGYRNFSGKESEYNAKGNRNFTVFFDADIAARLEEDGWNIRWQQPREGYEGEAPRGSLKVSVRFDNFPPQIVLVKSSGKRSITEDMVDMLDYADIESVDLIISPYDWSRNGRSGRKAYLKKMYVTLAEDEIDRKYSDIPDLDEEEGIPFDD